MTSIDYDDLARLDAHTRLRRIAEARSQVDAFEARYLAARRDAILAARQPPDRLTWREIGAIFGVTAQRAQMMARQPDPTPPPRPRKDQT